MKNRFKKISFLCIGLLGLSLGVNKSNDVRANGEIYTKVNEEVLASGEYLVVADNENGSFLMSDVIESKIDGISIEYDGNSIVDNNYAKWIITNYGDYYTISNGTSYLGWSGSSTNLKADDEYSDPKFQWTIIYNEGKYDIINIGSENARQLLFQDTNSYYGAFAKSNADSSAYNRPSLYRVDSSNTDNEVKELFNKYYNDGVYVRDTSINLTDSKEKLNELKQYFHAEVNMLNRTTYFVNDALWMSNEAGSYSYYGTNGNNMTGGRVNKVKDVVNNIALSNTTMEAHYTTLFDIKDNEGIWTKDGEEYTCIDPSVIKMFLDFTAPCFLNFNKDNAKYIIFDKVVVREESNTLVLELHVNKTEVGKLSSEISTVLSTAIISKEAPIYNQESLQNAINSGKSNIRLANDISLSSAIEINNKNTTLDLNGYTVSVDYINENGTSDAFYIINGSVVNFKGNGVVDGGEGSYANCAISALSGSIVNIFDGEYKTGLDRDDEGNCVVFAKSGAVINIYGGYFKTLGTYGGYNYTLNITEGEGTAINVYGGTYYNFNPAVQYLDKENIKVPAGSEVSTSIEGDATLYSIIMKEVNTQNELQAAINMGSASIKIASDISLTSNIKIDNYKNVTIDLNGKRISADSINPYATVDAFLVTNNSVVTFVGEGEVYGGAGSNSNCAISALSGSTVNIYGGHYETGFLYGGEEGSCVVFCKGGSVFNIYGGTFKAAGSYAEINFTLNLTEGEGTGYNLYGGTFYNYDPSTHPLFSAHINIPSNYKVVKEVVGSDTLYSVVLTSNIYTFSDYEAGVKYADNEVHKLDDIITITTTDCDFADVLCMYSSPKYNGYAIIKSEYSITSIGFNAGYNKDIVNIYVSNDGETWILDGSVEVTATKYNNYSYELTSTSKYIKLDVEGANQIRFASISFAFEH